MKTTKALFIVVLAAISFSSCKKDKKTTIPIGTVTATIDGNVTNFSTQTRVFTGASNNENDAGIEGIAADGSSFTIVVFGTLTAGTTYTSNDPDPGDLPTLIYISGNDNYSNDTTNPSVVVTITAVNASSIQGTFSGSLTEQVPGADQGKVKVITNGKFNVPRQ